MTSMTDRLAALSAGQRAGVAERVERARSRGGYSVRRRAASGGAAAASFAQERLWFVDALDPGNGAYNITVSLPFDGPLNVRAIASSLEYVIGRHEVLRTTFSFDGEHLSQVVRPAGPVAMPVIDLGHFGPADRDAQADHVMSRELDQGFDLANGPMLRAVLLRLSGRSHILLLTTHHISSDGWSTGILQREIMAAYAAYSCGAVPALPDLAVQYSDYAEWQRLRHQRGEWQPLIDFWKAELDGAPETLNLPTCRPRPLHRRMDGQWIGIDVPAALVVAIENLARKERCTVFMILLAAFAVLLQRFSSQDDVVIGVPVANRGGVELEPLIGFFVNAVPMRIRAAKSDRFVDLVQSVRGVALRAFQHQELPFEKLVEELEPERELRRNPIFQATFSMQNLPTLDASLLAEEVDPTVRADRIRGSIKFDLSLHLRQQGKRIVGSLGYLTDLLDDDTGDLLAGGLMDILNAAVRAPTTPVSELVRGEDVQSAVVLPSGAGGTGRRQPAIAAPREGIAAMEHGLTTTWAMIADSAHAIQRDLAKCGFSARDSLAVSASGWAGWLTATAAAMRAGAMLRPIALDAIGDGDDGPSLVDGVVSPGRQGGPRAADTRTRASGPIAGSAFSHADIDALLGRVAAAMRLPPRALVATGALGPVDSAFVALLAATGGFGLTGPSDPADPLALLDHATWEGVSALVVRADQARRIAEESHIPLDALFVLVVDGPLSSRAAQLLVERGGRGMVLTNGVPLSPWLFGTDLAAAAAGITLGRALLDIHTDVRDADADPVPVGALGSVWARAAGRPPMLVLRGPARRRPDGMLEARVEDSAVRTLIAEEPTDVAGPIAQSLSGIWEDVLGHPVGIDEDFFAAGGHSLRAAQAVARVKELLRKPITIQKIFEERTVRRLADDLAMGEDGAQVEQAARLLLQVSALSGAEAAARLSATSRIAG